jgi:hypothetical protein
MSEERFDKLQLFDKIIHKDNAYSDDGRFTISMSELKHLCHRGTEEGVKSVEIYTNESTNKSVPFVYLNFVRKLTKQEIFKVEKSNELIRKTIEFMSDRMYFTEKRGHIIIFHNYLSKNKLNNVIHLDLGRSEVIIKDAKISYSIEEDIKIPCGSFKQFKKIVKMSENPKDYKVKFEETGKPGAMDCDYKINILNISNKQIR